MNKLQILKLLNHYEQQSRCPKKQVAAVLVSDSKMIEFENDVLEDSYLESFLESNRNYGVNNPILMASDVGCERCMEGWKGRLCPAIHAEAECLIGKAWRDTYLHTLIISWSPCPECCKLIIAAGIGRVIVKEPRIKKPSKQDCSFYKVETYDELAKKLLLNVHYVRLWEKSPDWEVAV